jgi:hypothetical protein
MKNPWDVVSGFKHDNRLKCHRGIVSQGNSVTVDVSSGSKCHSGRNVGGRNVKAPFRLRGELFLNFNGMPQLLQRQPFTK